MSKLMRATGGSEPIVDSSLIPTALSWDCDIHGGRANEVSEPMPVIAVWVYPHDMRDKPDSVQVYSSYEEYYSLLHNVGKPIDLDEHIKNHGHEVSDLMSRILQSRYASGEAKLVARRILNRIRRASGTSEEVNHD